MPKQLKELRLPDYFTLTGLSSAVASIFFAFDENFIMAYLLLLTQFALDGIDGRIARSGRKGALGIYLDSFSDFTAIIAVVIFGWQLGIDNRFMGIATYVFIMCAAIRLSYFTVRSTSHPGDFVGIPTVLAVNIISTALILNHHFEFVRMDALVVLYYIFSYAMVSDMRIKKL